MHLSIPTKDSPREEKLEWLQWNDENGTFTDELSEFEDMEPMTDEEAWAAILLAVSM